MAMKYSRQREAIKEYLASTSLHPSAEAVYSHVKQIFPNISLGTVYRNLNLLTELGEAMKITGLDGGERFDATTHPHSHFYCRKCRTMTDIHFKEEDRLLRMASELFDGSIESQSTIFYGICKNCSTNSEE